MSLFCVVDVLGNRAEEHILEEIRDGGPILLMDRRSRGGGDWTVDAHPLRCQWGTGAFAFGEALRTTAEVARDIARLWRRHRTLEAGHFLHVILLPLKRAKWRGLLNLYRPRHYLGRDEYNPDHILRHEELRRIGSKSHGWSGGIYAAYTRVAPNCRYISFDTYYAIGAGLFDAYKSTWPANMTMRSIGTFGIARSRLQEPGADGQPSAKSIVIALRIAFAAPEYRRMVQALLDAFPERRFILQVKSVGFLERNERWGAIRELSGGRAGVTAVEGPIYSVLEAAACLVSDISSVIAEAIALGIPAFVADVLDQDYCVYREFPGLCAQSAEELVPRVRAALANRDSYPFADFRRRMGLGCPPIGFDAVRKEMGLSPRASQLAEKTPFDYGGGAPQLLDVRPG